MQEIEEIQVLTVAEQPIEQLYWVAVADAFARDVDGWMYVRSDGGQSDGR